jgi:hypothetical protein
VRVQCLASIIHVPLTALSACLWGVSAAAAVELSRVMPRGVLSAINKLSAFSEELSSFTLFNSKKVSRLLNLAGSVAAFGD